MTLRWGGFEQGGNDSHDGLFRIVKETGGYELRQWKPISKTRFGFVPVGYFAKLKGAKDMAQGMKDDMPMFHRQGLEV